MRNNTRRTFLKAAVPAVALAAPAAAAARQRSGSKPPPRKRVYRTSSGPFKPEGGAPLYSLELSFGDVVFVSGKGAGVDAKGDIRAQTTRVLDQIEESLKTAGSSMDKVLKVNVYLSDIKDYAGMNEAYLGRFGPEPPVRTTVAVAAMPDRSLVEIDCIAYA
jgi:enamine deaminase RidA (YjgF/YER057c/UK114 family)